MTNVNITSLRKDLFGYVDRAVRFGEVVNVSTKNGDAVIMSADDYNAVMETIHLCSIPGMVESIKQAAAEPDEECVRYDPEESW